MIDLQKEIKLDVSRRQRGIKIRVGDFFMRGIVPVGVLDREASKVKFQSLITGDTETVSHKEFTSYALSRLKYSGQMSGDYLKTVWGFAGARETPIKTRAKIVKSMIAGAPTEKDEQQVRSWLFALSNGAEPKR